MSVYTSREHRVDTPKIVQLLNKAKNTVAKTQQPDGGDPSQNLRWGSPWMGDFAY